MIEPSRRVSPEDCSDDTARDNSQAALGCGKALGSPISATSPTADKRVDPTQATQPRDEQRPTLARGVLGDQLIETVAAGKQHVVAGQVLAEHDLGKRLMETRLREPFAVSGRPRLARPVVEHPAAQEHVGDAVAGTHQLVAQILTGAHQVT